MISWEQAYLCGRRHVFLGISVCVIAEGVSLWAEVCLPVEDACHCKRPVLVGEGMSMWAFLPVLVGVGMSL